MKKAIKNPIFIFILSAIIFGSMGVVISATILAKDVSYTPSNTNWKVDNVGDAIDELYNNYKNKISTLQITNDSLNSEIKTLTSTNTELNNQVNTLTTKLSNATNAGLSGVISVTNTTTVYTVNVGFKPSKVFVLQPKTTNYGNYITYSYDSSISSNFIGCWSNNLNVTGEGTGCSVLNRIFSLTDTGFTFKADNNTCYGTTYWYAMK